MIALGFDTSNYTTSVACFSQNGLRENASRLLPVKPGALGLRQSDAVFAHVNALPALCEEVLARMEEPPCAVGVSIFPRRVEGSYMPCFKVGELAARVLAAERGIPCYTFSHQEGHLAAALVTTGHEALFSGEFLAWHLSGGTTELLHVTPGLRAEKIGGTKDISAGQLLDRTGVMLGLAFPAGAQLDAMARVRDRFSIRQDGLFFSLSGMENQVKARLAHVAPEEIAGFVLCSVADILARVTATAQKQFGALPVLVSGGVAGSRIVRERLSGAMFCPPRFSSDNALGIAALAVRAFLKEN